MSLKNFKIIFFLTLAVTSLYASLTFAATSNFNKQLNYQGKLADSTGVTVPDGDYNFIFRLYTSSSGPAAVWTEVYTSTTTRITVTNGLFSVLLGQITSLSNVDFNQDLYLSVNVGASTTVPVWDGEMTPRKRLGTVPAAFVADTLDGLDSESFLRSDDADIMASSSTTTLLRLIQSGTGNILTLGNSSATYFTVTNSGNVGIGTTSPGSTLSVQGNELVSGTSTAGNLIATSSLKILGSATTTAGGGINIASGCFAINGVCVSSSGSITGSGAANRAAFWTSAGNLSYDDAFTWDNTTKRLGLGTTSPYTALSVAGDIVADHIYATSTTGTSTFAHKITIIASTTNQAGSTYINVQNKINAESSTNGTHSVFGQQDSVEPLISSGVTNGGSISAVDTVATRSRGGDLGNLAELRGIFLEAGHTSSVGSTASTTNVYGELVNLHAAGGSIANMYGIYINPVTSGGTLNASYGIVVDPLVGTATTSGILVSKGNNYFNYNKGDYDFVVRGQNENSLLYVDASANAVGIGTSTPGATLSVQGDALVSGTSTVGNLVATSSFKILGTATSSSAGGFNITAGCFAINGVCVGGGSVNMSSIAQSKWATSSDNVSIQPAGATGIIVGNSTTTNGTTTSLFATTASTTNLYASTARFATTTTYGLNVFGSATSTFASGININSGCFAINGTCVVRDTSGNWTGTFDGQEGTWYIANSFSTTSADNWITSTTSLSQLATLPGLVSIGSSSATTSFLGNIAITGRLQAAGIAAFATTTFSGAITANANATNTFVGGILAQGNVRISGYNCSTYSNSGKLTTDSSGNIMCANDVSGSGGTDGNWTFINGSGLALTTTTNQVLIGAGATSTTNTLEVIGTGYFSNKLGVATSTPGAIFGVQGDAIISGTTTSGNLVATNSLKVLGSATSSFGGGINISSGCFALNGTCISSGITASQIAQSKWATSTNGQSIYPNGGTNVAVVVGATATSTSAKLEVSGLVAANSFYATDTTATSTFANKFVLIATTTTATGGTFMSNGPIPLGLALGNLVSSCNGSCFGVAGQGNLVTVANYGGGAAGLATLVARGNEASPSATLANDVLTFIGGRGFGNSIWNTGSKAAIQFIATQNYTDTANGTAITFGTTPNDSSTRAEVMRIDQYGHVGIGTTTPSSTLSVQGDALISGSTTVANLIATGTLKVLGVGTSTAGGGWNITSGCFAINGVCVGNSSLAISSINQSKWATSSDNVSIQPNAATGIIVGNSTTTNATSTSLFATTASTTNLYANTESIASSTIYSLNLLGNGTTTARNGINISSGCFAINGTCVVRDTNGNWTGTFDGQEGTWYIANSFSTTSADNWSQTLATLPGLVSFGSSSAKTTALGNLATAGWLSVGSTSPFLPLAAGDISASTIYFSASSSVSGDESNLIFQDKTVGVKTLSQLIGQSNQCTKVNTVLSGGTVTWSGSGYTFYVSPVTYCIGGIQYQIATTTVVTLTSADPSLDRIDDIIANTSTSTGYITGTPSSNPVAPAADPNTQIILTFIFVQAGSTQPGVLQQKIYQENIASEWSGSQVTPVGQVDFNNTTDPYQGSKNTEVTTPLADGDYYSYATSTSWDPTGYATLSFYIKNKTAWAHNQDKITITFRNALDIQLGNSVILQDGAYGFSRTNTTNYQLVAIPLSDFGPIGGSSIKYLRFTANPRNSNTLNFRMDQILTESTPAPNNPPTAITGSGLTNQVTYWTGSTTISGSDKFTFNETTGRLGLGTTTPATTLSVQGNALISGTTTSGNLIATGTLKVLGVGTSTFVSGVNLSSGCFALNGVCVGGGSVNMSSIAQSKWATSSDNVSIQPAGATGIIVGNSTTTNGTTTNLFATTASSTSLYSGDAHFATTTTYGFNMLGNATSTFNGAIDIHGAKCFAINGSCINLNLSGTGVANRATFWSDTNTLSYDDNFVWNNTTKRLGLGTTSPYAALSVAGTVVADNYIGTTTATSSLMGGLMIGTTTSAYGNANLVVGGINGTSSIFLVDKATGYLGLGSSTPNSKLTVINGLIKQSIGDGSGTTSMNVVGGIEQLANSTVFNIEGQYLYTSINSPYFAWQIYDITDYASTTLMASTSVGVSLNAIAVNGKYVHLLTSLTTWLIYDVSNPRAPVLVSTTDIGDSGRAIAFKGNYAFIARDGNTGDDLQVWDISNPAQPLQQSGIHATNGYKTAVIQGNYLFTTIADPNPKLQIFNVTDPTKIVSVSPQTSIGTATSINDLKVSGRFLYLTVNAAASDQEFQVWDISDITTPVLMGGIETGVTMGKMDIAGHYLYACRQTNPSKINVFDISVPTSPQLIANYSSSGSCNDVKVHGHYLYAAFQWTTGNNTIRILDIGGAEVESLVSGNILAGIARITEGLNVWGKSVFNDSVLFASGLSSQGPGVFSNFATGSLNVPALRAISNDNNRSGVSSILEITHFATSTSGVTAGIGAGLSFSAQNVATTSTTSAMIAGILTNVSTTSPAGALTFSTKSSSVGVTERARLTANGWFGIGTSTPGATLSVQGDELVSGTSTVGNLVATSSFKILGTATSSSAGGFNITGGCFAINSTCITTPASSFGVGQTKWATSSDNVSIQPNSATGIIVTNSTTTSATSTSLFSTTASSTSIYSGDAHFATTTTYGFNMLGNATSTFNGAIFNKGTATSTFVNNGINLTGGCFAINGSCITSGSVNMSSIAQSKWATSSDNVSIQPAGATGIIVGNSTTTNGTTTNLFATTASTTNLYADNVKLSSSTIYSLNLLGNGTTTARNGINISSGCFAINGVCVGGASLSGGAANRVTFWTGASSVSYDDTFVWDNTNKRLGLGTTSPAALFAVSGNAYLDTMLLTIGSSSASSVTINYAGAATNTINSSKSGAYVIATSTTAAPIFSISTNNGPYATTTFGQVGFDVNSGAIQYDPSANRTSIENLDLGPLSFEEGAGMVQWVNLPATTSTPNNTQQSYSAMLDSNEILTIYSQADAVGGLKNRRVVIGSSTNAILGNSNIATDTLIVAGGGLCVDKSQGFQCAGATVSPGQIKSFGGAVFMSSSTGVLGVGTSTPGATFAVQGDELVSGTSTVGNLVATSSFKILGTATSSSAGGFNITAGCFALNGVCVGGGSVNMSSIAQSKWATSSDNVSIQPAGATGIIVGNSTTTNGTTTNLFATTASSTSLYSGDAHFATTTTYGFNMLGNATSTFNGAIFNKGTATSTFVNNGINLTGGCFAINGTCLPSSGVSGTGAANRVTFWTGASSVSYDDTFVWDNTNKRLGLGTTSPAALFAVSGNAYLDTMLLTIGSSSASSVTINYAGVSTSTIIGNKSGAFAIATSTTAPAIFSISTNGQFASTSFGATGFDINNGAFQYDPGANKTYIENLDLGPVAFEEGAGWVSWIDIRATTSSAAGTAQAYTAQLAGTDMFTIFGQADGTGGIKSRRVVVGSSTNTILGSNNFATDTLLVAGGALCADYVNGSNCSSFALRPGSVVSWGGANFMNGNVGVGSTSPYAKLSVNAYNGDLNQTIFAVGSSTASATTTFFVINRDGNVGLGTTTPYAALSIEGPSGVVANKYFATSSIATSTFMGTLIVGTSTPQGNYKFAVATGTTGSSIVVDKNGRIGLGTTTPQSTSFLTVDQLPGTVVNSNYLCIDTTGAVTQIGSGSNCSASSEVFKHDINSLTVGLDELMKLRTVSYYYNGQENWGQMYGFIAEEVNQVDPLLAYKLPDGTIRGLRNELFTALITKSVQELNTKLDTAIMGGKIDPKGDFWTFDDMGRITAPADINFAGHKIVNVDAIESFTGSWSISSDGTLQAKTLCLEDVCVGKTELRTLLDQAGIGSAGGSGGGSSEEPVDEGSGESESTTTTEIIEEEPTPEQPEQTVEEPAPEEPQPDEPAG